ncbi:hypothetical protein SAMN00808754_1685 [Thermanaeromonas toyohensis ToBE]|uniref:Uncharacterized protein n=1 Tax=Thermanaeromonas toyohensis ToBE TaxID=698762 RepID=A0A1W1VU08_9FIRM|nr:hypothetical protein [Thermanaeromonas toyohensis]SMB96847.1 hypothetical protein SAMN00808754_1685 [Thermanaeromonas toyohensis ToBE]
MYRKKKKKLDPVPLLHVYGQRYWHDEAVILGNKEALEALARAVEKAIKSGHGEAELYTADGEGYTIVVLRKGEPWPEGWEHLALPYTDDCARERREDAVWPWELPGFRK